MDRRKFITTGVSIASLGSFTMSGAAQKQGIRSNHGDSDVTYLGDDDSHRYFAIDQNEKLKLNIINKETGQTIVKDYEHPGRLVRSHNQGKKRPVGQPKEPNMSVKGESTTNIPETPKNSVDTEVYEVDAPSSEVDRVVSEQSYSTSAVNVIKRAGERNDHLDKCFDSSSGYHEWNVLCVELNEHVSAVSKAVIATQIVRVAAKRAPKALANFLTEHRVEAALTAVGVSTLTGGDTLSFGVLNWDQSIPHIRDQKMSSGKVGVTDFKPDHDDSALMTWVVLPIHQQCC